MWIPESLPLLVRSLREERRLSQADLARRAGVAQQRVSKIERGVTHPGVGTLERLCPVLQIDVQEMIRRTRWAPSAPGRPNREVERRFEEAFAPPGLYAPPYERSFSQRIARLRTLRPLLVGSLESVLHERADVEELAGFLAEWPAESAEEALHVYWLCCLGMKGALLSPSRMGCSGPELYDWESKRHVGHLLMRALVAEFPDLSIAVWPQVPVRVRDAGGTLRHFRVDHLVGLMGPSGAVWAVLEVDGSGHDGRNDGERSALLSIPVLRVGEQALLADGYHRTLLSLLRQLYAEHAPSVRRRLVGRKPPRHRAPRKKTKKVPTSS